VYNTTSNSGPAFTRTIAPASGQAGNLGNPIEQQGTNYYIGSNNGQTFGVSPYTPSNANTFINNLNINQSPQSISVFSNGSSLYSSSGTWTASDGGNFLTFFGRGDGGSGIMAGNMNEILVYNSVLTSAQRQVIEGYLAWKWNIQSNLSSNHPFRYAAPTSLSIGGLTNYTYSTSYLPGLTAWYDAADPLGTGVQPANSTVMSNWYDKSGNSNTMLATGSPTYTTASQNSLPGITLSGNSGTTISSSYQTYIPPGTFLAELDAFVVYKNTGISSTVTYNTLITRNQIGNNFGNPLDIVNANFTAGLSNASFNTSSYNIFNTATSIFNINISQNTTTSSKMSGYTNGSAITFTLSSGSSTWTPSDIGNILSLGSRGDRLTGFNGLF
jgi:hypothetical protein